VGFYKFPTQQSARNRKRIPQGGRAREEVLLFTIRRTSKLQVCLALEGRVQSGVCVWRRKKSRNT